MNSHNTDVAGADTGTVSLFPKCSLYCVADCCQIYFTKNKKHKCYEDDTLHRCSVGQVLLNYMHVSHYYPLLGVSTHEQTCLKIEHRKNNRVIFSFIGLQELELNRKGQGWGNFAPFLPPAFTWLILKIEQIIYKHKQLAIMNVYFFIT